MGAKQFNIKSMLKLEWLGGCIALAMAALIFVLLIRPSVHSFAVFDDARLDRETAVKDLIEIRRRHQDLLNQIVTQKQQLASLGGSPPSLRDKENQIARINAIARECQLAIDQYSPIGDVDTPDYSAAYVAFTGRGTFPNVREFLHRMESKLDYVDVTHFTLTATTAATPNNESGCLLTLSCKLSGMPRQASDTDEPASDDPGSKAGEVALREP